jgi:hypothetical protein
MVIIACWPGASVNESPVGFESAVVFSPLGELAGVGDVSFTSGT